MTVRVSYRRGAGPRFRLLPGAAHRLDSRKEKGVEERRRCIPPADGQAIPAFRGHIIYHGIYVFSRAFACAAHQSLGFGISVSDEKKKGEIPQKQPK